MKTAIMVTASPTDFSVIQSCLLMFFWPQSTVLQHTFLWRPYLLPCFVFMNHFHASFWFCQRQRLKSSFSGNTHSELNALSDWCYWQLRRPRNIKQEIWDSQGCRRSKTRLTIRQCLLEDRTSGRKINKASYGQTLARAANRKIIDHLLRRG